MERIQNIKSVNKDGIEKEYDILSTFDYKNRKFVIYTDYSIDETNNVKIYSGIYDNKEKIMQITDSEDANVASSFIKFLEKGLKENILFA